MAKQFGFEIKIISVLFAVLTLVTATGFLAYKSLTGIVADISAATHPDAKLSLLKQILYDLSDAESSVKSYNLTRNSDYLSPFYSSISAVDERMNELQRLSKQDPLQRTIADSIHKLIEKKYELLDEMLALHYDEKITDELKKISTVLEKKVTPQTTTINPPEEKPSTIFRKIFGKKEPVPIASTTLTPENHGVRIQDIQKEVAKIKEEQDKQMQEGRDRELALTQESKEVMDNIRSLITHAEKHEINYLAEETKRVETRAKETNLLIAFFCGAIVLLLFTVSYVIIRYVHKNKEYERVLNNAKTEAENLAKARERFLANMSHEIRTPMNAIAGFTEQVLKSRLGNDQKVQLEIVKKSADHLLKIINDILDFSKIQAGKLPIEKAGFMPHEIIQDVMVLMTPQAQNKKIILSRHIESGVPAIVIGDSMRLKQVLLNLVSNAIKFTEEGEISMNISSVKQEENKIILTIKVKDTGIGIANEKLKHIFEEFEQADDTISKRYGGTGLGLTICKRLVELQNGSITISSKISEGTLVTISIPYEIGSKNDLKKSETELNYNGLLQGKNILVADDEPYNRLLISTIVKKWGATITESETGEEVLTQLCQHSYDVILMDVRMPGMDGITTCKNIRQMKDPQKAAIPIIALTAGTSEEEKEQCLRAGMTGFLAKPFKEKELHQQIVSLLSGKDKSDPTSSADNENHSEEKKYTLEGVRQLAHNDEKFFNDLVQIFIHSTKDGFIQMNNACAEKDWDKVAAYAHKIIPPCVHFEAKTLVALLKLLENNIRMKKDIHTVPAILKEAFTEAEAIIGELEK